MRTDNSDGHLVGRAEEAKSKDKANRCHEEGIPESPLVTRSDGTFSDWLDDYFKVSARGSQLQTEIRSGFINWMTMSYILVVNPVILGSADAENPIPAEGIMTATALSAAIGSLIVGLAGDAPLGLMPGMGLNAYFAFGICRTFGVSFGQAMSCCFVSGALLLLLAVLGVCNWVVTKVLSEHLKKAITVAIGVFQALIGFQVMGLVVSSPDTLITLGDVSPSNAHLYLAIAGFCLISAMLVRRLHGAILVGILAMSVCAWCTGLCPAPSGFFSLPSLDSALLLDFSCWFEGGPKLTAMIIGSLVLLFVALFDLAGVQFGLMGIAGLLKDGVVPRSTEIFSSAAIGTMSGALLGTSPVIIANESSAGIVEGARTGLSALVVSGLFIVSAFVTPLLSAIPRVATSVPLVLIGAFMMAPCQGIDWDNLRAAIPSFLTITVVPFTYSIHNGIIAGILMDGFLAVSTSKEEPAMTVHSPHSPAGREPLLGSRVSPTASPLPRILSTPHAVMAFGRDEAVSTGDKVEKAQQLLGELRRIQGTDAEDSTMVKRDGVLLAALEAYLASDSLGDL
eukprot:TRINITY_DN53021_c0_g1_i1.p1 TRINITY_DN53021_c0_g1~~TRINITY_DN53021_c0_g1_i1.p1  ORF type:complete len:566 (+),score=104.35 TRINITY_DN53021_c0_g1_i1:83-1780(+)